MSENDELIQIDKMSVDQAAGAFVMVAGAIGSLLLVVWQSKCHCKVNLCYIFQCDRRPPNEDEMKTLKDQAKKLNKKDDIQKSKKTNDDEAQNEDELSTPRLIPRNKSKERIIENESEIDKLV
jgi:hypothetical protein